MTPGPRFCAKASHVVLGGVASSKAGRRKGLAQAWREAARQLRVNTRESRLTRVWKTGGARARSRSLDLDAIVPAALRWRTAGSLRALVIEKPVGAGDRVGFQPCAHPVAEVGEGAPGA